MKVEKLDQLFDIVRSKPRKRLIAAYANDAHTIEAVSMAVDMGIIDATLVCDEPTMKTPAARITSMAETLSPMERMVSGRGPMKIKPLVKLLS